jgi:hypothetical protein
LRGSVILFALLLAVAPAGADSITLRNGGTITGTIDEVTFIRAGKPEKFQLGKFTALKLNDDGRDALELSEGKALAGEFVSLRMKTVGGMITFTRKQVKAVVVMESPLAKARKEYLRRRTALKLNDARAMYELAAWCDENNLKAEARDLAARCLKFEPDMDVEESAHKMLGHVLRDGKWILPVPKHEPDPPKDKPEPKELGPADPAVVAAARKLIAEYNIKLAEANQADSNKVKETYGDSWTSIGSQIKDLTDKARELADKRRDVEEDLRLEERRYRPPADNAALTYEEGKRRERIDSFRRQRNDLRRKERRIEDQVKARLKERKTLSRKVKAARTVAARRARDRSQRYAVVKSKVLRLVGLGHKLTEDQMRKALDAAIK